MKRKNYWKKNFFDEDFFWVSIFILHGENEITLWYGIANMLFLISCSLIQSYACLNLKFKFHCAKFTCRSNIGARSLSLTARSHCSNLLLPFICSNDSNVRVSIRGFWNKIILINHKSKSIISSKFNLHCFYVSY